MRPFSKSMNSVRYKKFSKQYEATHTLRTFFSCSVSVLASSLSVSVSVSVSVPASASVSWSLDAGGAVRLDFWSVCH